MREHRDYEAPQVRDLDELGISGQFPLATNTCTVGTGDNNGCISGSNTGNTTCTYGNLAQ
jgi:hypothetical protein